MTEFVQVPPDSTGKKIGHHSYVHNTDTIYVPSMHLTDPVNHSFIQSVDRDGAAHTTFTNGAPIFDTFGRMETSHSNLLGAYRFYEGPKAITGRVQERLVGGGNINYSPTTHGYVLQTTAPIADEATLSAHRHFPNEPGASQTFYFTIAASDSGKTGLRRVAGMLSYDEADGVCIEMNGTAISIVMASSLGNGHSTLQSAWNRDKLDGTGKSGATLDMTKANTFWITHQYPAGAVSVGTFVNGEPVFMHEMGHYATLDRPFTGTTNLAPYFRVENTGSVGSTSEMTVFSVQVLLAGPTQLIKTPLSVDWRNVTLADATVTPVFSFRPAQTFMTEENRRRFIMQHFSGYTATAPVALTLLQNATLVGDTFAESVESLEWDTTASSATGGRRFGTIILSPASDTNVPLDSLFSELTDGLFRHGDITNTDTWTITVESITAVATETYFSAIMLEIQ